MRLRHLTVTSCVDKIPKKLRNSCARPLGRFRTKQLVSVSLYILEGSFITAQLGKSYYTDQPGDLGTCLTVLMRSYMAEAAAHI